MNVSFDKINTSHGSYQLLQKVFGGVKKKAYLAANKNQNKEETLARLSQPKDHKHDYYRR